MVVRTDTERTRHSRRLVLELLGLVGRPVADRERGPVERRVRRRSDAVRATRVAGGRPRRARVRDTTASPSGAAETVDQPVKVDNPLYVRDYAKCILCYQCVDACGEQWQQTWAIGVAGRGFDARISTEYAVELPDSACVYCGNCIQVCPTGALMFTSEHEMRAEGTWDEERQAQTDTICPYCGVGCTLTLHVQDGEIVKVTSPSDNAITSGNLCIKGRFGFQHVQNRPSRLIRSAASASDDVWPSDPSASGRFVGSRMICSGSSSPRPDDRPSWAHTSAQSTKRRRTSSSSGAPGGAEHDRHAGDLEDHLRGRLATLEDRRRCAVQPPDDPRIVVGILSDDERLQVIGHGIPVPSG